MKRCLITGARGFVGRNCLAPAVKAGYEVHATYRGGEIDAELLDLGVTWHQVDLLDRGAPRQLIETIAPTHLLHMAWDVTPGSFWNSPSNLDWLSASTELISAFGQNGGERLVSAGTCAEYDWSSGKPLMEDISDDRPTTFYGRVKLLNHSVLMTAAERYGFNACTGRMFLGYGPHEDSRRLIPYACNQLHRGDIATFGNGDLIRDFLHVSDIGTAFVELLGSDVQGKCNISSGRHMALVDIIRELGSISGRMDLIRFGTSAGGKDEPQVLLGDNSKLRAIGWAPKVSLRQGLEQAYEWWGRQSRVS
jgi:nucleoside-diphosphate-sugar epimerase